jgi:hypothetical protein
VILGQVKDNHAGHFPFALEPLQLFEEAVGAALVAVLEVEAAKERIEVPFQALDRGRAGAASRILR